MSAGGFRDGQRLTAHAAAQGLRPLLIRGIERRERQVPAGDAGVEQHAHCVYIRGQGSRPVPEDLGSHVFQLRLRPLPVDVLAHGLAQGDRTLLVKAQILRSDAAMVRAALSQLPAQGLCQRSQRVPVQTV